MVGCRVTAINSQTFLYIKKIRLQRDSVGEGLGPHALHAEVRARVRSARFPFVLTLMHYSGVMFSRVGSGTSRGCLALANSSKTRPVLTALAEQ